MSILHGLAAAIQLASRAADPSQLRGATNSGCVLELREETVQVDGGEVVRTAKWNLISLRLGVGVAVAAIGGGAMWCQAVAGSAAPGQQGAGTTTLQVYSRETVVDVTATDQKGNPVSGLQQSDFTILEDGKPQAIRYFKEYSRDTPLSDRQPPQLPPDVYMNLQPPPNTSAVNILLLDALNTAPADQVFMKEESIRYLKSMPKGTRVAVLGLSSRLRILQGFTSDPSLLVAVVDSKKNRSLPSPFIDTDTGDTIDSLMDIVDDGTAASLAEFENEQSTFQADMRNRMTLEALDQIAAYVAGIKGRKNLIWFTDGMPLTIFPTQAANVATGGTNDLQGMTDYSKDLRKTTDLLTAAEVSVYPVDARGLFSDPANSAAKATGAISAGTAAKKAAASMAFQQKTAQEHLSMEAVAEATGGAAFYNTNDLKTAVTKAIENGANYYTISYVPPGKQFDGRYHSVEVKVDRPGVRLSYRRGYDDDDIEENSVTPGLTLSTTAPEPYGNNMQASMQRGAPTASELLFSVKVDPVGQPAAGSKPLGTLDPKLEGKPLRRYEFHFSMPGRQIAFMDTSDGRLKAGLEFDLVAYDVYGKVITQLSQSIDLPLTRDRYQQLQRSPFQVVQQLDLPPGEIFLRAGILDRTSEKVGTLEIPLTVKKGPAVQQSQSGGKAGE